MGQAKEDDQVKKLIDCGPDDQTFLSLLKETDSIAISEVIGKLSSTGLTGARMDARRDACMAVLQAQLTERLVGTMVKLETTATRLTWVGIVVAVVVGIAQIILPLMKKG